MVRVELFLVRSSTEYLIRISTCDNTRAIIPIRTEMTEVELHAVVDRLVRSEIITTDKDRQIVIQGIIDQRDWFVSLVKKISRR